MTLSTAAAAAPQTGAAQPPAQAGTKKPSLRLFTIRTKFALFTVLLFFAVMGAVGYSLYVQQKQSLTREVLGRGRIIAANLATAAREAILQPNGGDLLALSVLAHTGVQQGAPRVPAHGDDLGNAADWLPGLTQAFEDLQTTVPKVLERAISQMAGQAMNWGFERLAEKGTGTENEGVFEVVIVNADGRIASHYLGTDFVGKVYEAPKEIQAATADAPYPIYLQEADVNGRKVTRRLFHLQQPIVQVLDGVSKTLGTVHLGIAEDLVNSIIFAVTMKLAAIALAAVALGAVVTYILVTVMTAPIGRLVNGVLGIAGGDFDTRVKVGSRDELGELTSAFNTMAVSLGQNEMLKGAFTRYVSDAALKQILSDPGKTGLHSQRTMASIYSSDVRGFTAMSETLEPEQVVQVINTYLSLQTEIILQHGGVVDKFIGDATIGVWGKETPAPDDAINAVRAAWDAQAAIAKMNEERAARGEVVKLIGIGVNSGEVVSGNMGSSKKMEYTVTGEHVIFADRICDECPGGKVWISESTYELVKDKVVVEEAALKGKGHEIKVYQVNGFK